MTYPGVPSQPTVPCERQITTITAIHSQTVRKKQRKKRRNKQERDYCERTRILLMTTKQDSKAPKA